MENEYRSINDQILESRRLAVQTALADGINNDGVLTEIANNAEKELTNRVGHDSESKFENFTGKIKFVKEVFNPHLLEDLYMGIDKWIRFDESLKLPDLPVQIKSSAKSVDKFKNGDPRYSIKPNWMFRQFSGLMVVVDCGPHVTYKQLKLDLWSEAQRIRELIDNNHSISKQFILKDSNSFKIR